MKLTRILMVLGVLLLAVGFVGVPVLTHADGAVVAEEWWCGDGGLSGVPGGLLTTDSHSVITPSGNTKITCIFVVPSEYIPTQAVHYSEFLCYTFLGETYDTFFNMDTEGTALLRCQIKPPKE